MYQVITQWVWGITGRIRMDNFTNEFGDGCPYPPQRQVCTKRPDAPFTGSTQSLRCSPQYSFSKNFLTALTKGRGFSTCTAWPLSGIMIISQSSFPLGPSDPHSAWFIISMRIFCEMSLNFASFSPATMSKGLFKCFRSSHRDLVH